MRWQCMENAPNVTLNSKKPLSKFSTLSAAPRPRIVTHFFNVQIAQIIHETHIVLGDVYYLQYFRFNFVFLRNATIQ